MGLCGHCDCVPEWHEDCIKNYITRKGVLVQMDGSQIQDTINNKLTFKASPKLLPIRPLQFVESLLQRQGKSLINISPHHMMNMAIKKSGLSDWGEENFQEPMQIFIESLEKEAHLDFLGRLILSRNTFGVLYNRLCIQDEIKNNQNILREEIKRPLFIVSLGRTGTTLLHYLLCLDPSIRYLHVWESNAPSLHPKLRLKNIDNRQEGAKRAIWLIEHFFPELSLSHLMSEDGPDECVTLFLHTFFTGVFESVAHVPTYINWLKDHDKLPSYLYYRKILQLLQWHKRGDHWVLKAPMHLVNLDVLLKAFPDACIVQTHRDPVKVIPSLCSFSAIVNQTLSSDNISYKYIIDHVPNLWANWLEKAMEVRKASNQSQFYDIHYRDLMNDPTGTVKKIYDYFGYHYDSSMERRISQWLANNKQHKKGVHRYTAEQFGLNASEIRERYSRYIKEYDIPQED